VLIIALAALSVRTVARNRDWRDDFTLCSAALLVVPDSAKMHNGIAVQYAGRGELDTARLEFQTALGIFPTTPKRWSLSAFSNPAWGTTRSLASSSNGLSRWRKKAASNTTLPW